MFKKLILGLGIAGFLSVGSLSVVNAEQGWNDTEGFGGTNSVGIEGLVDNDAATSGGLIDIIKSFINWTLGMLSLIALVILLFGGFKMVTAAGDETKYKDGFKILQQAAVGLAVIGLSWFIVSIIFWVIAKSGGGAPESAGGPPAG